MLKAVLKKKKSSKTNKEYFVVELSVIKEDNVYKICDVFLKDTEFTLVQLLGVPYEI